MALTGRKVFGNTEVNPSSSIPRVNVYETLRNLAIATGGLGVVLTTVWGVPALIRAFGNESAQLPQNIDPALPAPISTRVPSNTPTENPETVKITPSATIQATRFPQPTETATSEPESEPENVEKIKFTNWYEEPDAVELLGEDAKYLKPIKSEDLKGQVNPQFIVQLGDDVYFSPANIKELEEKGARTVLWTGAGKLSNNGALTVIAYRLPKIVVHISGLTSSQCQDLGIVCDGVDSSFTSVPYKKYIQMMNEGRLILGNTLAVNFTNKVNGKYVYKESPDGTTTMVNMYLNADILEELIKKINEG